MRLSARQPGAILERRMPRVMPPTQSVGAAIIESKGSLFGGPFPECAPARSQTFRAGTNIMHARHARASVMHKTSRRNPSQAPSLFLADGGRSFLTKTNRDTGKPAGPGSLCNI